MEMSESHTPTDDELSRFLEDAENQLHESDEMMRRHNAVFRQFAHTLILHEYEPLTDDSARFFRGLREVSISMLADNTRGAEDEDHLTAEEIYEMCDDEDKENLHQIAAMILNETQRLERFLILQTVLISDEWQQSIQNLRLGSPESITLYHDLVERKKQLYAVAVIDYQLDASSPVVKSMLDFLPGEVDPESDEMITYIAHYFADHITENASQKKVIQGAYELLGIDIENPDASPDFAKMAAVNKVAWQATLFSIAGIYRFEQAIREEARELPLTEEEIQLLLEYYADVYADELTSPPDEAVSPDEVDPLG